MKMYEVLSLQEFYVAVKDKKLPLKTAYKLSRLMKRVEEEIQFYNQEFNKILDEYAKKENNNFVFSKDGTSIEIIPGKEEECNNKTLPGEKKYLPETPEADSGRCIFSGDP